METANLTFTYFLQFDRFWSTKNCLVYDPFFQKKEKTPKNKSSTETSTGKQKKKQNNKLKGAIFVIFI